jgi:hypothetical protein
MVITMKGQYTGGTRLPVILIGLILFVVGLLLLLPLIGLGALLPFALPITLPETIAGISSLMVVGGITAIGFIMLLVGIINPNYMLQ